MGWIDCHAHLADRRLEACLPEMLQESRKRGVAAILANAARRDEWDTVLKLAGQDGIYAALGIHPFFPEQWTSGTADTLRRIVRQHPPKLKAIGEIGLDFWNGRVPQKQQEQAFAEQLQIAREARLPVCLHNRKSWQEFFGILKDLRISSLAGYCHNFTAGPDIARKLLDLGLYISFCSPLEIPDAHRARSALQYVPLERLLTETDCPDLPPALFRGQFSAPWHVSFVLQTIAELKHIPLEQAEGQVQANFRALFLDKTEPAPLEIQ